ncbi:MAG: hypothetical protein AAFX08_00310 [Pseudomonadota bacterium]
MLTNLEKAKPFGAAALAAFIAGCATAPEERVNKRVAAQLEKFEPTGEERLCLPLRSIASINAATETKFLVRVGLNDYYLTETPGRCIGATLPLNRIQYIVPQNQLCANEIVTVVDNTTNIAGGSCGLGPFKELRLKETKKETSTEE